MIMRLNCHQARNSLNVVKTNNSNSLSDSFFKKEKWSFELFKIRQSEIYYDGLVARLDKRLIDQAFYVPSIFFFIISYRFKALKTLYFYFYKIIKKKKIHWNNFCKVFSKKLMKKIILGTSDAWSMSHLSNRATKPS